MNDVSRSQREIQKAAHDFARGEFDKDLALQMETDGVFPERIWKKAGELGFLGLHYPERYSGGGLGFLETVLVTESFCRRDSSIGSALAMSGFGAECILHFGHEDLKHQWLPALAEGRVRAGAAFWEAGVRADWTGLRTRAAREGDSWQITGTKTHVFNVGQAGCYIVACRTDADEISLLLVEADRPGIAVRGMGRRIGFNMIEAAELDLVSVQVPADHLVGERGRGAAQLEQFMGEANLMLSAMALGIAAGAFDRALAYVKEREAFGRKLAAFDATRGKIAAMVVKIEAARTVVYQAARRQDAGGAGNLPLMAKMTAARTAVETADDAIQLFGGYGYMKETEVERFYRDAKMVELLLGGNAAAYKTIANTVIGKI